MTLLVPDDLAGLIELVADYGNLPAVVINEPADDEEWDGIERPVLRAELYADLGYIGLHTAVLAAGPSPQGALNLEQTLQAITALMDSAPLELFWVSSLRPLGSEADPESSGYSVRLALPLRAVAVGGEPPKVAFLAQTNGLPAARTA